MHEPRYGCITVFGQHAAAVSVQAWDPSHLYTTHTSRLIYIFYHHVMLQLMMHYACLYVWWPYSRSISFLTALCRFSSWWHRDAIQPQKEEADRLVYIVAVVEPGVVISRCGSRACPGGLCFPLAQLGRRDAFTQRYSQPLATFRFSLNSVALPQRGQRTDTKQSMNQSFSRVNQTTWVHVHKNTLNRAISLLG